MSHTLSTALEIVLPALAPALATPDERAGLRNVAAALAPIARGGFEVRLRADAPQVDLQQCIVARNGEPDMLRRHLQRAIAGDTATHPAWQSLNRFLNQWATPTSAWNAAIFELWLEFDRVPGSHGLTVPSLFLGLPSGGVSVAERWARTEPVLDLLLESTWQPWRAAVRNCFMAHRSVDYVSHIGVMLSRQAPALRINVKRLRGDTLPPYLRSVGWGGDAEELAVVARPLFDLASNITVCLDVGEQVASQIGLECTIDDASEQAGRWSPLLDHLVDQGWCSPAKRDALLSWVGTDTPPDSASDWPDDLLAIALTQNADTFPLFQRRLSHVKVMYRPGLAPEAKGYLWFGHRWLRAQPQPQPGEPAPFESWNPADPALPYLERVRAYYEATTPAYLDYLGTTFQGWLLEVMSDAHESNRRLARRAGVEAGQLILDAGCGVGGPAIDIAGAFGVTIEGITISETQARVAGRLIAEAGLEQQVRVCAGDFHDLPWPDEHFDMAIFLESAGQTEQPLELFAEMFRVLKPGGALYIKDAFKPADEQLSPAQQHDVATFDRLFVYRTRTLEQTVEILTQTGFQVRRALDLSARVTGDRWRAALQDTSAGATELTPFGELHRAAFSVRPLFCGEILARKPQKWVMP